LHTQCTRNIKCPEFDNCSAIMWETFLI
jgi:hypothetical protein